MKRKLKLHKVQDAALFARELEPSTHTVHYARLHPDSPLFAIIGYTPSLPSGIRPGMYYMCDLKKVGGSR